LQGEQVKQAKQGKRPSLPSQIFQSISLPIDSRVSAKVQAKIWNGEYIDFGTLLGNPMLDEKLQISVRTGTAGTLFQIKENSKILDNWMAAFHIFVGVYTVKYPMDAPILMKYGDIVRHFL
jgi:hypothetical protein